LQSAGYRFDEPYLFRARPLGTPTDASGRLAAPLPISGIVMSGPSRPKRAATYYKVSFTRDQELYQICARSVQASDLYGLLEISEFVFPESKLVFNPGEERLRREFEGILRTFLPYHAVVRIDEVLDTQEREIKIVPLHPSGGTAPIRMPDPTLIKTPER
jgi:hypothetical protein